MIQDVAIKYNQKQVKTGLIVGIVMLLLFIASLFYGSRSAFFAFGIGITYIGLYFYRRSVNYLTVKNGWLKKDWGAKIPLTDIVETRRFAGDYIFRSNNRKIVIDKNAVDAASLPDVENLINAIRNGKV